MLYVCTCIVNSVNNNNIGVYTSFMQLNIRIVNLKPQ